MAIVSAAQPQDVIARWRPFEDDNEALVCATRLADVHRKIRKRFTELERNLEDELAADEALAPDDPAKGFRDDVVEVECEAVIRVMILGSDRYKAESIDDWSGTRDKSQLEGKPRLTDEEWAQIGATTPADDDEGKAFTIDQTPAYAGWAYDTPRMGWQV